MFLQLALSALIAVSAAYPQNMGGIAPEEMDVVENEMGTINTLMKMGDSNMPGLGESVEENTSHEPNYMYEYEVKDDKSGDYKTHRESRKGDFVEGYYSLVEPDGTLREVRYTASKKDGFKAVVTKSGKPYGTAPRAMDAPRAAVPSPFQTPAPEVDLNEDLPSVADEEPQNESDGQLDAQSEPVKTDTPVTAPTASLKYKQSPYLQIRNARPRRPYSVYENARDRRYY